MSEDSPTGQSALSVSELNRKIAGVLSAAFSRLWVRGEVSNLRQQASGHIYFSLKDRQSQVSAVLFRGQAQRLPTVPRDGMEVLVLVEISVYEPRGSYQVIVRDLIDDGLGKLQRAFLALRQKLQTEGLFAEEKKRAIPQVPSIVGVVTSPTGAALRDICSVLQRGKWCGRLIVFPTLVQGATAAPMIASAVASANQFADMELLVVGRGGGSLEDLWPFNEEQVVRAVAASRVPVISAVGHEIDTVLSDLAADWRSPTPTAAAEKIAAGLKAFRDDCSRLSIALKRGAYRLLQQSQKETQHWCARLTPSVLEKHAEHASLRIDQNREALDRNAQRLLNENRLMISRLAQQVGSHHPSELVHGALRLLKQWEVRLRQSTDTGMRVRQEQIDSRRKRISGLSVGTTLQRGFSVVRNADGKIVRRASDLTDSTPLTILFEDGQAKGQWQPNGGD